MLLLLKKLADQSFGSSRCFCCAISRESDLRNANKVLKDVKNTRDEVRPII
jgi:hypothetical protein